MSRNLILRATTAAAALLGAFAAVPLRAQDAPPPWWGVADNDTVSLYWSFDNQAAPFQPTSSVVPAWYTLPPNGGFTNSPNVTWIGQLNGHVGVVGFQGAGNGTMALLIDNDPRYDWIKIFWFQYDALATGSADVVGAIRQDLAKYQRAIVSESSVPLANGWVRTTVSAQLIPQPIDETIDFTLTGAALASVAIDDLWVNSKCVKPPPDEDGDASGQVDQTLGGFDLNLRTGNPDCSAAAAVEDQNGVVRFFVAGTSQGPGQSHEIYALSAGGVLAATVPTNVSLAQSQRGVTDLAVAELPVAGGTLAPFVFGVIDRRSPLGGGDVLLLAVDPTGAPSVSTARSVSIPQAQFPSSAQSPFGLAFFPPGDGGNGTFWISEQGGEVYEFTRQGQPLRTLTPAANGTPTGLGGATYDALTGRFYWFSSTPSPTTAGPLQVRGVEHSAYDFQPTGNVFYGDLNLPGPAPGGVARGMELLRRGNGDFRLLCVTRNAGVSRLTVIKGPFAFGWNLLGRIAMRGEPMQGNTTFGVELSGVPRARAAVLQAGFSNRTYAGQNLPFNLAFLGLDESNISVALQLQGPLTLVQNGRASTLIPLPPAGLRYLPLFFQWVVFDPTAPNGIATSQAGKTVIY